jgi:hypothetical protein
VVYLLPLHKTRDFATDSIYLAFFIHVDKVV